MSRKESGERTLSLMEFCQIIQEIEYRELDFYVKLFWVA
ncbi:conserved protein of unknown function [Petrocella atlantisensis]|uniref:Uncharacterized protein n=1 Tax=Petrocella atlantisensis TaxID=2173034 RepID=A0A3P7P3W0_9FIRM|nr:conserved protein of unknown function [Petrocella atlantisensis]